MTKLATAAIRDQSFAADMLFEGSDSWRAFEHA